MRLINYIEVLLIFIYVASKLMTSVSIANYDFISVISAFVLGVFYFPLGFYTLRNGEKTYMRASALGLLLSVSTVSIIFSLLKIDLSLILLQFFMVVVVLVALGFVAEKLIKKDKGAFSDIIRLFVAFVLMYWAYSTYLVR